MNVEELVLSGLDYLILSIDGATENTYSRFRRGGDFNLVIDNVKRLVAAKKRLKSYTPLLDWQFLVFQHNIHEIELAKELTYSIGVNQLRLAQPYSVQHDDPAIMIEESFAEESITYHYDHNSLEECRNKMLSNLDEKIIDQHFFQDWRKRYKQIDERFGDVSTANGPICEWLYKNITMDARGRIMPCCAAPEKERPVYVYSKLNAPEERARNAIPDDLFNSNLHVLSRLYFKDKAEYELKLKNSEREEKPFCSVCPHPDLRVLLPP